MIIFDIDGTLWNVAELTTEAANMVASRMPGVNTVTLADINSVMGMGRKEIIDNLYPGVERETAARAVESIVDTTSELISERGGNFYDGVVDTVRYLSKKYKLGLVTNNTNDYVKLLFDKSGLADCFVDYIGATTYGFSKAEAIRQMVNRNQVSSACYVGDIKKDMEAAAEAGVGFIHARYGFDKELVADVAINDIRELVDLL